MGFLVILILSLGAFGITRGSKCVPATADCSRHWVKLEPHKNLMETERDLNFWCRKQALFYRCLENVLIGKSGNLSDLPTKLLISKMFSEDLCLEGSKSRQRYLNNAACINQLDTEYCTLPEYLDIVTPDDAIPPSRCSLSEKTFSCIAATIVMNCGFEAGRVYRYLLKVTTYSEEVCDVERSQGVPPCEDPEPDSPRREEELSEIFYGLVHRFGIIPEQASEPEEDSSVLTSESPVTELDESSISEAIRNALDAIDGGDSSDEYDKVSVSEGSEDLESRATERYSVRGQEFDKNSPIIAEPFKGLLYYNYSRREFAIYWRQPDFFPVETVECEHLLPSFLKGVIFRCVLNRRLLDPGCVSTLEDEPLTPELVRDVDPGVPENSTIDFGPRPYWMDELDEYKRQKELREQSKRHSDAESSTDDPTLPAKCASKTFVDEMVNNPDFKWWKCSNIFSEELREEIASVLIPDVKESDIPLMSAYHTNNIGYMYVYEAMFHDFESIFCARVNECHPRGRGVFKCSMTPRKIERCDNCYEESSHPSPAFDNLRNFTTPSDLQPTTTEEMALEGSGNPEYETITLLLDSSSEKGPDSYAEGIVAEGDDDLVAIDISTEDLGQPASPDLRLMFIDRDAKESSDDESQVVYAADGVIDDQESDATYRLSSDDNEYRLLHENVFVLQAVPPNDGVDATYEMVDNSEEKETSKDADVLSMILDS